MDLEQEHEKEKEPEQKKRKSLPKILDGTFYSTKENDKQNEDGKIDAICTECNEPKKGHIASTGNFKMHYKMKHPSRFKDLENYLQKSAMNNNKSPFRQPVLNEFTNSTTVVSFRDYFY